MFCQSISSVKGRLGDIYVLIKYCIFLDTFLFLKGKKWMGDIYVNISTSNNYMFVKYWKWMGDNLLFMLIFFDGLFSKFCFTIFAPKIKLVDEDSSLLVRTNVVVAYIKIDKWW